MQARSGETWAGGRIQSPAQLKDFEDPPGEHLSHKDKEHILNGYFLNIFTLLRLEAESGKTCTNRDKKGATKCSTE